LFATSKFGSVHQAARIFLPRDWLLLPSKDRRFR